MIISISYVHQELAPIKPSRTQGDTKTLSTKDLLKILSTMRSQCLSLPIRLTQKKVDTKATILALITTSKSSHTSASLAINQFALSAQSTVSTKIMRWKLPGRR